MAVDIQALFNKKIKPLKFDRSIGLFGATTIGVGALLGAGIYVLIGAAANEAGPSVVLSYVLCGSLAFITTMMFAELSRIIPRSGGGYTYAYDILGSFGGFTTGWFLALGSILASSLYAIGFAEYAGSLAGVKLPQYVIRSIAIGITLLITLFNLRPSREKKFNLQNWIVWGNVGILMVLIVLSFFYLDVEKAKPVFPHGFKGTLGAISLIYISFFGYQLIANNADEIIEPEKTVPKAMKLSMLIAIAIYALVAVAAVMTVPWKELADSQAPLVLMADRSFGGNGWMIISLGGVLASLGALSSTLVSQSRQSYSMGKDRFFPDAIGKLNEKTKQPQWALITGGVLTSLALASFSLETIAKVTNFSLLLSLLPVSLAMRKLYKNNPAVKPKAKWKRLLPELSLVINLALLFTLDIFSLALGQQLVIAGALIYFFYSRGREKTGREGLNIVLEEQKRFSFFKQNKILVPMSNPETQKALLTFSHTLLSKKGGEVVVLAIKDVPEKMDFYEALSEAEETLEVIKRSIEIAKKQKIRVKPIIRASRKVSLGIVNVAREENSDLVIMGFPKQVTDYKTTIFNQVLKTTHTDLLVLHLKADPETFVPEKIGVYIKDTNNLHLMLMCATAVAEKRKARIVLISFVPPDYSKQQKTKADKALIESLQNLKSTALYDIKLNVSDNPKKELIKMSSEFDAMIVGKEPRTPGKTIEDSPAFQIARDAKCTVVLVKMARRFETRVR
ncbi:MAG: amino acid permease [Chlorobi bacterium]|nr:amino acid permease [Chlorobiota bacterium]